MFANDLPIRSPSRPSASWQPPRLGTDSRALPMSQTVTPRSWSAFFVGLAQELVFDRLAKGHDRDGLTNVICDLELTFQINARRLYDTVVDEFASALNRLGTCRRNVGQARSLRITDELGAIPEVKK